MHFPFKISSVLQVNKEIGFAVLNGITLAKTIKQMKAEQVKNLSQIINNMGYASASAQKLKQIITTFQKFVGSDNRMYLKIEDNTVLGILKVGERNLFYRDQIGNIKQIKPTCVLDFYVHESCQRSGIGRDIFDHFLKCQNRSPQRLAYDRPSQKLIGFLRKHFALSKHIPQNNNYVIFNAYFDVSSKPLQSKNTKQVLKKDVKMKQFTKQKQSSTQALTKSSQQQTKSKNSIINTKNNIPLNKGNYQLRSPWANNTTVDNVHFRTTSNSYGDHYRKK